MLNVAALSRSEKVDYLASLKAARGMRDKPTFSPIDTSHVEYRLWAVNPDDEIGLAVLFEALEKETAEELRALRAGTWESSRLLNERNGSVGDKRGLQRKRGRKVLFKAKRETLVALVEESQAWDPSDSEGEQERVVRRTMEDNGWHERDVRNDVLVECVIRDLKASQKLSHDGISEHFGGWNRDLLSECGNPMCPKDRMRMFGRPLDNHQPEDKPEDRPFTLPPTNWDHVVPSSKAGTEKAEELLGKARSLHVWAQERDEQGNIMHTGAQVLKWAKVLRDQVNLARFGKKYWHEGVRKSINVTPADRVCWTDWAYLHGLCFEEFLYPGSKSKYGVYSR